MDDLFIEPYAPADEDLDVVETCKVCGNDLEWTECFDCGGEGEGEEFHDCGEDCCCCADPEPGMCPTCGGKGGWLECPNAEHHHEIKGA